MYLTGHLFASTIEHVIFSSPVLKNSMLKAISVGINIIMLVERSDDADLPKLVNQKQKSTCHLLALHQNELKT